MITNSLPELHTKPDTATRGVGVIFKTHLDLGFTDLAENVYRRYMTEFMPAATKRALEMKDGNGSKGPKERFVWTTGSWLVTKYLEYAKGRELRDFEETIRLGLIRWHALPFTFQSEILDESLLEAALTVSKRLDARFGVRTIAAKMTDVPGHTRGIIPGLAAAGVKFLHIGVNPASTVPEVPPLFRWQHPSGEELLVCYEDSYGGIRHIPGTKSAYIVAMTGDNSGPPPAKSLGELFDDIRRRFPRASLSGTTLEEMAAALDGIRKKLPVVGSEIGDTWIHGYGSDAWKLAALRGLSRLRREWIRDGKFDPASRMAIAFDDNLLLGMEHTWGLDEKTWMSNGKPLSKIEDCYLKAEFQSARKRADFKRMEVSWQEQRDYVHRAIALLPKKTLAPTAFAAVAEMHPPRSISRTGWKAVSTDKARLDWGKLSPTIRADGALRLPGAAKACFGAFSYQVFGSADYARHQRQYLTDAERNGIWAPFDFGKPGLERVLKRGRSWKPTVDRVHASRDNARLLVESSLPEEAVKNFGAPAKLRTTISVEGDGSLSFDLHWLDKPACRIPEALWFAFLPPASGNAKWHLHKLGGPVKVSDVVPNGSRHLHLIESGVSMEDSSGKWHIESADAGLVAPGKPSLLDFHNNQPEPSKYGIHFNLLNNTWGTNFPMWYEDDARFRFRVAWDE